MHSSPGTKVWMLHSSFGVGSFPEKVGKVGVLQSGLPPGNVGWYLKKSIDTFPFWLLAGLFPISLGILSLFFSGSPSLVSNNHTAPLQLLSLLLWLLCFLVLTVPALLCHALGLHVAF